MHLKFQLGNHNRRFVRLNSQIEQPDNLNILNDLYQANKFLLNNHYKLIFPGLIDIDLLNMDYIELIH